MIETYVLLLRWIGACSFVVVGISLFVGTLLNAKWVLDPPDTFPFRSTQLAIKRVFGADFLWYYSFFGGIAFTLTGLWLIYHLLLRGEPLPA